MEKRNIFKTFKSQNEIKAKNYFENLIKESQTDKPLTLEQKRETFIKYVKEACKHFKISPPSINFETIEHFKDGEDGHFHPDECKICVDEDKLKFLKLEKIRELAYHEVTHAFMGEHDNKFWNKMRSGLHKI